MLRLFKRRSDYLAYVTYYDAERPREIENLLHEYILVSAYNGHEAVEKVYDEFRDRPGFICVSVTVNKKL